MPFHQRSLAERVAAKYVFDPKTGCWLWTAGKFSNGYGQFTIGGGGTRKNWLAHRLVYEMLIGPIPLGMQLDHFVCDNGAGGCVNPHHCRPVTHRENMLRSESVAARNLAKTHCPLGHPYDEANTIVIRRNGNRSCRICVTAKRQKYWQAIGKVRRQEKRRAA